MSSCSTSTKSKEHEVFDSDTLSDLDRYSRSRTSSGRNSVSGVYTSWFDNDMNSSKLQRQYEQRSVKDFEIPNGKVTKCMDTTDNGLLNMAEYPFPLTVLGGGTRLMNDILFPTVIIKMPWKRLRISMVYYIVLEPVSGLYTGDIPCLLFSNPKDNKKDAQTAELLPLRISLTKAADVSLSPLLLQEHYRSIFQEGCIFKVNAIKSGRRVIRKERKWQYYDLNRWEMMHDLLRRLIWLDINQMPNDMLKQLNPLRVGQQFTQKTIGRRRKSFISFLLNKKRGEVGVPVQKFENQKLSYLYPDLRLPGLSARGGSSFAAWFKAVPPDTHVDKEFTCDRNTKFKKDTFKSSREYDEYLNISAII